MRRGVGLSSWKETVLGRKLVGRQDICCGVGAAREDLQGDGQTGRHVGARARQACCSSVLLCAIESLGDGIVSGGWMSESWCKIMKRMRLSAEFQGR